MCAYFWLTPYYSVVIVRTSLILVYKQGKLSISFKLFGIYIYGGIEMPRVVPGSLQGYEPNRFGQTYLLSYSFPHFLEWFIELHFAAKKQLPARFCTLREFWLDLVDKLTEMHNINLKSITVLLCRITLKRMARCRWKRRSTTSANCVEEKFFFQGKMPPPPLSSDWNTVSAPDIQYVQEVVTRFI